MLLLVKQNLSWYQLEGSIGEQAAASLEDEFDQAVKDYVPYMNTALGSLGVPQVDARIGPIARDYVAFNSQADAENFNSSGAIFDVA